MQKHAARRLHYDLRLEIGDALASWAVTRGPSLVPGDKRLAVHVEDHPLDYADFEGEIPKGQYGGGEVIVWDRGRWEPEGDPARGLKKGRLDFTLEGAKLKGRWHLVRMGAKRGEKRENWLLIKGSDEAARSEADPDILEEGPASVISGRTVEDIAAGKPARKPPTKPRTRCRQGASDALPRLRPAGARHPQAEGAARRRLGARDQVRRLPAAGADPRRQGEAADPQRSGLDRPVRQRSSAALSRRCRPRPRSSTASWWSKAPAAPPTSPRCRRTCRRTAPTASATISSISSILDGEDLRAEPLVDAQGPAGRAAQRRARAASPQRAFRRGRRGHAAARLPAQPRRAGLQAARRRLSGRPHPAPGSSRNAPTARSSSSPATCRPRLSKDLVGSLVLGYHKDGKLVHAGRVGTGFSREVAARPGGAAGAAQPQVLALRREADRRRGARRRLGQARARRRGRVPRLDRRRHPAPRRLPRSARGQAGARDHPRGAGRKGKADPSREAAGPPDPSRPRLLAGRRRHQAGPRRLLRRGLAAHGAASSSTVRSRSCAARAAPRASASSRSTPGRVSAARS